MKNWLAWGAGPRAAKYMILGAKARAILHGRFAVGAEDIRAMAYPVLRHRLFTNFNADAEGIDVDQVIEKILDTVPEPSYGEAVPTRQPRRRSPAGPGRPHAAGCSAHGHSADGHAATVWAVRSVASYAARSAAAAVAITPLSHRERGRG